MLISAVRRWRDRRRERRIAQRESKIIARTTLRDFKKWTVPKGARWAVGASAFQARACQARASQDRASQASERQRQRLRPG